MARITPLHHRIHQGFGTTHIPPCVMFAAFRQGLGYARWCLEVHAGDPHTILELACGVALGWRVPSRGVGANTTIRGVEIELAVMAHFLRACRLGVAST